MTFLEWEISVYMMGGALLAHESFLDARGILYDNTAIGQPPSNKPFCASKKPPRRMKSFIVSFSEKISSSATFQKAFFRGRMGAEWDDIQNFIVYGVTRRVLL